MSPCGGDKGCFVPHNLVTVYGGMSTGSVKDNLRSSCILSKVRVSAQIKVMDVVAGLTDHLKIGSNILVILLIMDTTGCEHHCIQHSKADSNILFLTRRDLYSSFAS